VYGLSAAKSGVPAAADAALTGEIAVIKYATDFSQVSPLQGFQ